MAGKLFLLGRREICALSLYMLPIAKLEVTPSVTQCSVFYYLRNLTNAFVCKKKENLHSINRGPGSMAFDDQKK